MPGLNAQSGRAELKARLFLFVTSQMAGFHNFACEGGACGRLSCLNQHRFSHMT